MNHSQEKSNQKIGPDCLCFIKDDGTGRSHIKELRGKIVKTWKTATNQIGEKSWTYKEPPQPFVIRGELIECIPETCLVKISGPDIDTTETETITKIIPKESPLFQD